MAIWLATSSGIVAEGRFSKVIVVSRAYCKISPTLLSGWCNAPARAVAGCTKVPDPRLRVIRPSEVSLRKASRSEEHTSELQSRPHLVCRLLLEKKKNRTTANEG